jgi:hypothetical protein
LALTIASMFAFPARGGVTSARIAASVRVGSVAKVSTRSAMAAVSSAATQRGAETRSIGNKDGVLAIQCIRCVMPVIECLLAFRFCEAEADQILRSTVSAHELRELRDSMLVFLVRTGKLHPEVAMCGGRKHGTPGIQQSQPAIAITRRSAHGFLQLP